MRSQPVNKRLQEVIKQNKYNLFARIAWRRDLRKDTIREMNMDEIRLEEKLNA